MGKISLALAAQWCGGQVEEKYADVEFLGACGDHRWANTGELFVTLDQGPYVQESIRVAMERGAAAVLTSVCCPQYPCIVVPDPKRALGDIARQERKRLGMKVIGVTGSVGKTTVTEMISCVLTGSFHVATTHSNQFDDIGVPMAILAMPPQTEVAVLEMGMNQYREIAYLTSVARPDIAVITNIGGASNEQFQSREAILQAKMEILEGMREDGEVILCGDDDLLWKQRSISHLKTLFYGRENPDCSLRAENVCVEDGVSVFHVRSRELSFPVELYMEQQHFINDALAAVCVCIRMGVEPALIQERLSKFRNLADKPEVLQCRGVTVIRDCYNAGPMSMRAALSDLGQQPGRHIAVLGDMLELGVCTQAEHYRVGRVAAENAQILLAYGPNAGRVISGALTGGMAPSRAMGFESGEKLLTSLNCLVKPGDTVLFKGCRRMHMEKLVDSFLSGGDRK